MQDLEHASSELTLQRRCLGAQYALRCISDRIRTGTLGSFDRAARSKVEDALGGVISDARRVQATLGVDAGGLGYRVRLWLCCRHS